MGQVYDAASGAKSQWTAIWKEYLLEAYLPSFLLWENFQVLKTSGYTFWSSWVLKYLLDFHGVCQEFGHG